MDWSLFHYDNLLSDVARRGNNVNFDEFYHLGATKLHEILDKIAKVQPNNTTKYFLRENGIQIFGQAKQEEKKSSTSIDIGMLVSGKVINCKNTGLYLVTFVHPEYETGYTIEPDLVDLLREFIV